MTDEIKSLLSIDLEKAKRKWLSPYKRNEKAASQFWRCLDCKQLLPALFHIDHRIPKSLGGQDTWDNLAAICPACHAIKTAKELEQYWDRQREKIYHISKYFQPSSSFFACQTLLLPPPPPLSKVDNLVSSQQKNQQQPQQQQQKLKDDPMEICLKNDDDDDDQIKQIETSKIFADLERYMFKKG